MSSVQERSLWQSFAVLPKRTRLIISGGFITVGLVGLTVSDWLEESFPAPPTNTQPSDTQMKQQQPQSTDKNSQ